MRPDERPVRREGQTVYVLEVNPRASRTVPFVSKATGVPLAKVAARVMAGQKLADMGLPTEGRELGRFCVKEAVMPFGRFPGADTRSGPRDEVDRRGHGCRRGLPGSLRQVSACDRLFAAHGGHVRSSRYAIAISARSSRSQAPAQLGFEIMSTKGTAKTLKAAGIPVTEVMKMHEGRPNIVDAIKNDEVQLVINTPFGQETRSDGYHIRTAAVQHGVTNITTLPAANAACRRSRRSRRAASASSHCRTLSGGTA